MFIDRVFVWPTDRSQSFLQDSKKRITDGPTDGRNHGPTFVVAIYRDGRMLFRVAVWGTIYDGRHPTNRIKQFLIPKQIKNCMKAGYEAT